MSWKSQKLKRAVASTLAGEALALSLLLAELEFIQLLFREMTKGDVKVHDPEEALMRYVPMVSAAAQLREYQRELALVDAKSVYDACQNSAVQGKQDKRTAIELCIIQESLRKRESSLRWMPHGRMVLDMLTKPEVVKGNAALHHLMKTGHLTIARESESLALRKDCKEAKGRSFKDSERLLEGEVGAGHGT